MNRAPLPPFPPLDSGSQKTITKPTSDRSAASDRAPGFLCPGFSGFARSRPGLASEEWFHPRGSLQDDFHLLSGEVGFEQPCYQPTWFFRSSNKVPGEGSGRPRPGWRRARASGTAPGPGTGLPPCRRPGRGRRPRHRRQRA